MQHHIHLPTKVQSAKTPYPSAISTTSETPIHKQSGNQSTHLPLKAQPLPSTSPVTLLPLLLLYVSCYGIFPFKNGIKRGFVVPTPGGENSSDYTWSPGCGRACWPPSPSSAIPDWMHHSNCQRTRPNSASLKWNGTEHNVLQKYANKGGVITAISNHSKKLFGRVQKIEQNISIIVSSFHMYQVPFEAKCKKTKPDPPSQSQRALMSSGRRLWGWSWTPIFWKRILLAAVPRSLSGEVWLTCNMMLQSDWAGVKDPTSCSLRYFMTWLLGRIW